MQCVLKYPLMKNISCFNFFLLLSNASSIVFIICINTYMSTYFRYWSRLYCSMCVKFSLWTSILLASVVFGGAQLSIAFWDGYVIFSFFIKYNAFSIWLWPLEWGFYELKLCVFNKLSYLYMLLKYFTGEGNMQ